MKYRCIKGFCLNKCDEDGFSVDKTIDVEEGMEFLQTKDNFIGMEIHLENESMWIEIDKEMLNEYFEEVRE